MSENFSFDCGIVINTIRNFEPDIKKFCEKCKCTESELLYFFVYPEKTKEELLKNIATAMANCFKSLINASQNSALNGKKKWRNNYNYF